MCSRDGDTINNQPTKGRKYLTQLSDWSDVATAQVLPTSGDTRLCPPAAFQDEGFPHPSPFREFHLWGFHVRSPCTLQVLCQNVLGLYRLVTGHRWFPTHRLEVIHGVVFLPIRLPATSLRHLSLLLLLLHLPVLLQCKGSVEIIMKTSEASWDLLGKTA